MLSNLRVRRQQLDKIHNHKPRVCRSGACKQNCSTFHRCFPLCCLSLSDTKRIYLVSLLPSFSSILHLLVQGNALLMKHSRREMLTFNCLLSSSGFNKLSPAGIGKCRRLSSLLELAKSNHFGLLRSLDMSNSCFDGRHLGF